MEFLIEYGASRSRRGGFSVDIWVNDQWQLTFARNTKTMRGAVNRAHKIADKHAETWRKANRMNVVTVQPRSEVMTRFEGKSKPAAQPVTPVTPAIDETELILANRDF